MTDQDIAGLGPAFAAFLRRFRGCFLQGRTAAHFDSYCRGLLSDLPRKSVEPIALASGTAVRTLQEFLTTASWDHELARDTLQRRLAEVPVSFSVRSEDSGPPRRADQALTVADAKQGRRYRIRQQTHADARWRARGVPVRVRGRDYTLVVAINEATAEVKYFLTNATTAPLSRVLQVAFRRATVEHAFRVAKSEAGLMHYEGRQYVGLLRHLILALIVLGFVSVHTERLRGEKSAGDRGASMPGAERPLCGAVPPPAGNVREQSRRHGDPLPPAPERAGDTLPQETAA